MLEIQSSGPHPLLTTEHTSGADEVVHSAIARLTAPSVAGEPVNLAPVL